MAFLREPVECYTDFLQGGNRDHHARKGPGNEARATGETEQRTCSDCRNNRSVGPESRGVGHIQIHHRSGDNKALVWPNFRQLRSRFRFPFDVMQTHIPAYDDYTGQPTANPVDDPCIPQPARDAAYDGQDDSRWDDDQESSSRQGPSGMSVSSSEVPKEEESISAAEAAKSRSFRALRTAKACDVSFSIDLLSFGLRRGKR
jgi:hypothetical protein